MSTTTNATKPKRTPEEHLVANLGAVARQLVWLSAHRSPGKRSVWEAWARHMEQDLKSIKLLTAASTEEVRAEIEHREAAGR